MGRLLNKFEFFDTIAENVQINCTDISSLKRDEVDVHDGGKLFLCSTMSIYVGNRVFG